MKIKVGDRIAIYYCNHDGEAVRRVGTAIEVSEDKIGLSLPKENGGKFFDFAHPKQCRKLKPKAKPREFWIGVDNFENWAAAGPGEKFRRFADYPVDGFIHVREVKDGK